MPPVHTLVARIKALKGAHTIEPAPEHSTTRRAATAEESVTTRIHRRIKARSEPQPEEPVALVTPAATAASTLFNVPIPHVSPSKPSYRQRATREEQPAKPQLSLFAQFITVCSASNRAEARPLSSPVQGSSPVQT
jgi:hypothetical protein